MLPASMIHESSESFFVSLVHGSSETFTPSLVQAPSESFSMPASPVHVPSPSFFVSVVHGTSESFFVSLMHGSSMTLPASLFTTPTFVSGTRTLELPTASETHPGFAPSQPTSTSSDSNMFWGVPYPETDLFHWDPPTTGSWTEPLGPAPTSFPGGMPVVGTATLTESDRSGVTTELQTWWVPPHEQVYYSTLGTAILLAQGPSSTSSTTEAGVIIAGWPKGSHPKNVQPGFDKNGLPPGPIVNFCKLPIPWPFSWLVKWVLCDPPKIEGSKVPSIDIKPPPCDGDCGGDDGDGGESNNKSSTEEASSTSESSCSSSTKVFTTTSCSRIISANVTISDTITGTSTVSSSMTCKTITTTTTGCDIGGTNIATTVSSTAEATNTDDGGACPRSINISIDPGTSRKGAGGSANGGQSTSMGSNTAETSRTPGDTSSSKPSSVPTKTSSTATETGSIPPKVKSCMGKTLTTSFPKASMNQQIIITAYPCSPPDGPFTGKMLYTMS